MSNKYIECFFEHSKTILFFKGEGDYFFRDPNWGVHLYYTPMSIVFDKIKENLLSLDDFLNGFYFLSPAFRIMKLIRNIFGRTYMPYIFV